MSNRAEEIKRRIQKRKKQKQQHRSVYGSERYVLPNDEERHGMPSFSSYESNGPHEHPLFRKDVFLLQILAAISLFLLVGIVFKGDSERFDASKQLVHDTFEKQFQFAAVNEWYKEQLGKPLALLPITEEKVKTQTVDGGFAVPVTGTVTETFAINGKGITLSTGPSSMVRAMNEGVVIFAGNKEGLGKTVILQHADGSETWYGYLKDIKVGQFDYVEKGTDIGKVKNIVDGSVGEFYFAIKKGDSFIDPIQVVTFD